MPTEEEVLSKEAHCVLDETHALLYNIKYRARLVPLYIYLLLRNRLKYSAITSLRTSQTGTNTEEEYYLLQSIQLRVCRTTSTTLQLNPFKTKKYFVVQHALKAHTHVHAYMHVDKHTHTHAYI